VEGYIGRLRFSSVADIVRLTNARIIIIIIIAATLILTITMHQGWKIAWIRSSWPGDGKYHLRFSGISFINYGKNSNGKNGNGTLGNW